MNCDQFRTMNRNNEAFLATSRGERASGFTHYNNCDACQEWMLAQPRNPMPEGWETGDGVRMMLEDLSDPEFFQALLK